MRRLALGLEVTICLTIAQIAVKLLPGHRVTRLLGDPTPAEPLRPSGHLPPEAWHVGHVVRRMAAVLPWHPVCLPQALAARALLRRRGIDVRSHLGITQVEPLAAHAWVSVDGYVIVGGPIKNTTEVAAFR